MSSAPQLDIVPATVPGGTYRCPGRRHDGTPCNALVVGGLPGGTFSVRCWRCRNLVRIRAAVVVDPREETR